MINFNTKKGSEVFLLLAIYLLVGFFIGSQTSRKNTNREQNLNNNQNNTEENKSKDTGRNSPIRQNKIRIRKKMKKYFSINSNNPEGIDPKKISVDIKKKTQERNKSSPEPSFIALSILWAHYVAKQLGILNMEDPSPWQIAFEKNDGEILKKHTNLDISRNSWRSFLSNIIIDQSWTRWIKNPDEVKKRTLLAFEN